MSFVEYMVCMSFVYNGIAVSDVHRLVNGGRMYVPHLGHEVRLANAFLTYTSADTAAVVVERLNGFVLPAVAPTVIKVFLWYGHGSLE